MHDQTKIGFIISLHLALFALIAKPTGSDPAATALLFGTFSFLAFAATLFARTEVAAEIFPALVVDDDQ